MAKGVIETEYENPIESITTFQVFPNPSKGQINLRIPNIGDNETIYVQLVNMMGETVYTNKVDAAKSGVIVNTGSLKAGVYIMQIQTSSGVNKQKVVIY